MCINIKKFNARNNFKFFYYSNNYVRTRTESEFEKLIL